MHCIYFNSELCQKFFFSSYHAAISLGHVRDKIFLIFVIKGLAVYTVFGKNPDPFMFNYSLCPITGICINKSCLSTFFFQFYQKKLWQKCCKSPKKDLKYELKNMFFFTSLTNWYIVNTYLFLWREIRYIEYDPLNNILSPKYYQHDR